MSRSIIRLILALGLLIAAGLPEAPVRAHGMEVQVLDGKGQPITGTVDGNQVRLRAVLEEEVRQPETVTFRLAGQPLELASCQVAVGQTSCATGLVSTLGWHWEPGGAAAGERVIEAYEGSELVGQTAVQVRSRPVVMVHGFSSTWEAWQTYLGPDGFLAGIGVGGFAVGDGQVPGVMNTGNVADPEGRTNTIAQNAAILRDYTARVKEQTGAEMVDLLAHSMGGLISRYYIGKVMGDRDVAQLIMLGSPMAGTECSYLPAALGFYLPAVLEIRPSYVVEIFNRQVNDRRGVPFNAVAGVPISNPIASPCSEVPSDMVISRPSISAIPLAVTETVFLHTDLNRSPLVFSQVVAPLLQTPPGGFGEPAASAAESQPGAGGGLQFSKIFTGRLLPGQEEELVIPIEAGLTVARFALYDTSRSLRLEVRGASGNVIELSAQTHGLRVVDDPETLVHLGYGFAAPKAGEWKVTLRTSPETPAEGAHFALTAVFDGGAELKARTSLLLPEVGQPVTISAAVSGGEAGLQAERVTARIQPAEGEGQTLELAAQGEAFSASWAPERSGLHSIEVAYQGRLPDGMPVQRVAFLVIDAQPEQGGQIEPLLLGVGAILILGLAGVTGMFLRLRRRWRARAR
jgi:pimeloyl-ACP methyl ester carboxylesterase